jgi:hypothetical protein
MFIIITPLACFLVQAFPLVAQTLGECISNRPDIRMEVLSALRKLCTHCQNGKDFVGS